MPNNTHQIQRSLRMATDIPASTITPDRVGTWLGTLTFFDGFPDEATVRTVYEHLDFQRGVKEANWVQTLPGKGWFVLLRLYGPLEPWFDKSWRPGEIEWVDWVTSVDAGADEARRSTGGEATVSRLEP